MPAKKKQAKREENWKRKYEELQLRLEEAEETLRAIREGEVDAVVVSGSRGEQVFSLMGAESIYRLIVETMKEAAFTVSFNGTILFCNAQFGEFVQRPMEHIVGHALDEFVSEDYREAVLSFLASAQKQPVRQRLVFRAADGTSVPVHISANVLNQPDGLSFCIVASNLTELENSTGLIQQLRRAHAELDQRVRERTAELSTANRMLRMVSECNLAVIRTTDEQALLREICRIAVEVGGYRMAWVGYAENDEAKSVRPVASVGFEESYLENARISWADGERGRGPTGTCIRTSETRIGRNFLEDPELEPWRIEALKRGYRSSIALPLTREGKVFGALNIYADKPNAFDGEQVNQLGGLANDLAFGILMLRARIERDLMRQTAEGRAEQLQALATELVHTEQRERRRLAQILHDHLQQLLVGAKFGASIIRTKSKAREIKELAGQLVDALNEAIVASRSLSTDLSSPVLHEKGLGAGLEWLGRQMSAKHGLIIKVEAPADAEPATEQVRVFMFDAVRELLLNIAKYAQVNRARVKMRKLENGEVEVTVTDDGVGFDPGKLEASASASGGFGLFSIRERLKYLGGRMLIDAAPGRGSRFTLLAPAGSMSAGIETMPVLANGHIAMMSDAAPRVEPSLDGRNRRIRVLLADDHPVLRQGLIRLLQEHPDIQVVGEADDGQLAVELAKRLEPDVVLMDVSMPRLSGSEATRRIVSECPGIRVIGLSMHEENDMAAAMCKAGAAAYVTKGGSTEHLISIIRETKASHG